MVDKRACHVAGSKELGKAAIVNKRFPAFSPKPGTSKSSENWRNKQLAEAEFGVAVIRPQDHDTEHLKSQRRVNLDIIPEAPHGYRQQLQHSIGLIQLPPLTGLGEFEPEKVRWFSSPEKTVGLGTKTQRPVISVDFEFHNEHTFDGMTCKIFDERVRLDYFIMYVILVLQATFVLRLWLQLSGQSRLTHFMRIEQRHVRRLV